MGGNYLMTSNNYLRLNRKDISTKRSKYVKRSAVRS